MDKKMKTSLTFTKKRMPGIPVGEESRFPALRDPIRSTIDSRLGEDDGLFVNYGMFSDSLPYAMQDDYDLSEKREMEFDCAVLENDCLRAEFIPSLGGRLWSLYDKILERDLLTDNTEFLPRNLAIRNAWFAGGAEFNCGRRGHDANTCSPRFTAVLHTEEYGPVLRIYDYSRDRKVPFQIDFFLPDGQPFLFVRVRICNPGQEVVPMYWWSNLAADMTPGCRVVVPASETYLNKYDGGSHFITKTAMPDGEGFDQTYPENFRIIRDHFYNIPEGKRKYISLFNRDGSGFIHLSTRRLQGRKLFVWGQATGGMSWQRKLLGPGSGSYLELQAGLAKTQHESLPMPPKTAWEWLEAYGGIQAEPQDIFGFWDHAVGTVTALADRMLPEETMDRMLRQTRESIALRKGEVKYRGSGSGALEELRSGRKLASQLDFGSITPSEKEWAELLRTRHLDEEPPRSFQVDPDWIPLLKDAPECWKKQYHLALYWFRQQDWDRALDCLGKALRMNRNAWTLHAYAIVLLRSGGDAGTALDHMCEAALSNEADAYLLKETFKLLVIHQRYGQVLDLYRKISGRDRNRPNIRAHYASALFHTGKPQEALDVLMKNGPLDLPDAREGESFLTELFIDIQHALGKKDGEFEVPLCMDFRIT